MVSGRTAMLRAMVLSGMQPEGAAFLIQEIRKSGCPGLINGPCMV